MPVFRGSRRAWRPVLRWVRQFLTLTLLQSGNWVPADSRTTVNSLAANEWIARSA